MEIDASFVWVTLFLLGAFHGINPGMGWLFAVALGLQEGKRSAVWRSLVPLVIGHALAVGLAIFLARLIGLVIPLSQARWGVAAILFGIGLYRLFRHSHPRYGGMRVGFKDLTVWSFLMASAHGAGLMVLPFVMQGPAVPAAPEHEIVAHSTRPEGHSGIPMHGIENAGAGTPVYQARADEGHAGHAVKLSEDLPQTPVAGLLATLIHTLGYVLVIGLVAVLVYEKFGLRLLRSAWVNLDLIWAGVLIATSILTVLV